MKKKKLYVTEHKSSNGSSPCKTFVNKILNRRTAVHELKVIRTSASNFFFTSYSAPVLPLEAWEGFRFFTPSTASSEDKKYFSGNGNKFFGVLFSESEN